MLPRVTTAVWLLSHDKVPPFGGSLSDFAMAGSSPLAQYASRLSQSPRTARAGSECNATFPMCLDSFGALGLGFRGGAQTFENL